MRRGAASRSLSAPWLRRRCVSSSSLASSLMRSSGPLTLMPAWSSCTSSRSTGTFRTSANWETVTSAILFVSSGLTRFEPVGPGRHDELARLVGRQPLDVLQILHRLLGEILARAHTAPREREREVRAHSFEQQQVVRRHRLIQRLLARDRLRQQDITRAIAQLLDDLLVELLDGGELPLWHIGDLLDGREALLRKDGGDVLVDVELLHEQLHQRLRLRLALGFGVGLG